MKPGLGPGVTTELEIDVTEEMAPDYDGKIVHPVYSTWSMIHHMEMAGRKLILPFLESHEEAVGTHVSADHTAPAHIGKRVRIVAEVESVRGNKVTCRMQAFCGPRVLGHGTTVQAVLQKDRLAELFERS